MSHGVNEEGHLDAKGRCTCTKACCRRPDINKVGIAHCTCSACPCVKVDVIVQLTDELFAGRAWRTSRLGDPFRKAG